MRIQAGQGPARLSLAAEAQGRSDLSSVAIAISQHPKSSAVWQFRAEGRFNRQAIVREVGSVVCVPPTSGARPSRVVAVATLPGTVEWFVQVERLSTDETVSEYDESIDVELSAAPDCSCCGIEAIPGASIRVGDRWTYMNDTVVADTTVTVPKSYWLKALNIKATSGSFSIGGGDAIACSATTTEIDFIPYSVWGPIDIDLISVPSTGCRYIIELGY